MWGIIIIATIIFLYFYHNKSTETFNSEPSLPPMGESYSQKLNELTDVDRVLDRPVKPGDKYIANLQLLQSKPDPTDNYEHIRKHKDRKLHFSDVKKTCIPKGHPIYTMIDHKQPYMFDKPIVVDYYGSLNYWDWKYPQKPIDIKFAADPKGFCKRNPNSYPCYVINSRKDLI